MENRQDVISIIIPIYNVKDYVKECVHSACAQTYRELEILLIDDGSTDGCSEICDALAAQDTRVHAFHFENGGLCAARNRGLDLASGKYVIFLDGDDILLPNYCELLHTLAAEHDAQTVRCNYFRFSNYAALPDMSAEDTNAVTVYTPRDALNNFVCAPFSRRKHFSATMCPFLFERSLYDGIRFPVGVEYEEGFVLPQLMMRCRTLVHVDASLYGYYINDTGITGKDSAGMGAKGLRSLDDWRQIHELLSPVYPELQAPTAERWAKKYVQIFTYLEENPELDADRAYRDKIVSVLRTEYDHLRPLLSRETLRSVNAVRRGKIPKPSRLRGYAEALRNKLKG